MNFFERHTAPRLVFTSERASRGTIRVGHQNGSLLNEVRGILVCGADISTVQKGGGAGHAGQGQTDRLLDAEETTLKVCGALEAGRVAALGDGHGTLTVRVDRSGDELAKLGEGLDERGNLFQKGTEILHLAEGGSNGIELGDAAGFSNIQSPDTAPIEESRDSDSKDAMGGDKILANKSEDAVDASSVVGVVRVIRVANDSERNVVIAGTVESKLGVWAAGNVAADP